MTSEPRRTLSDVSSDYALDAGFDSLLGTQLIDFSPTAMVIIDPDLRVRRSNRSFREIYGLSPEQLAGTSIPELLPDMDPRVWKLARWVLASGESVEDTEIIGRSVAFPQEERTWRFSHFPLRDREGVPAAVGVTLVDVTDQRRAERKHAEAERRLRLLTRASTLVGRSLELDATLASIADFMVPEFADTCSVYLLDEPLDTDARPELLELRRAIKTRVSGPPLQSCDIPFSAAGEILYCHRNSPIYQAFASGRPFHHAADDESLISGYQTPGFLDYFRRLLLRWGIAVPLLVGRYFHGVMVAPHEWPTSIGSSTPRAVRKDTTSSAALRRPYDPMGARTLAPCPRRSSANTWYLSPSAGPTRDQLAADPALACSNTTRIRSSRSSLQTR